MLTGPNLGRTRTQWKAPKWALHLIELLKNTDGTTRDPYFGLITESHLPVDLQKRHVKCPVVQPQRSPKTGQ